MKLILHSSERREVSQVGSLALTARWMAAARARESGRGDRLFEDPFAEALAGEAGFSWLRMLDPSAGMFAPGPGLYAVVRTRYFDEFLISALEESEARQVVILAAGMDARAFRMKWPSGTVLYELDLPEVLEFKEKHLERAEARSNCERRAIAADLRENSWLRLLAKAGYSAREPSVWLAEGFLLYLEEPDVHALLDGIASMTCARSRLGADTTNRDIFLAPAEFPLLETFAWMGAPLRFGDNDPESLLARHGWRARAIQPGDKGASYGRWPYPVPPRQIPGFPRSFLLTAHREP